MRCVYFSLRIFENLNVVANIISLTHIGVPGWSGDNQQYPKQNIIHHKDKREPPDNRKKMRRVEKG